MPPHMLHSMIFIYFILQIFDLLNSRVGVEYIIV